MLNISEELRRDYFRRSAKHAYDACLSCAFPNYSAGLYNVSSEFLRLHPSDEALFCSQVTTPTVTFTDTKAIVGAAP